MPRPTTPRKGPTAKAKPQQRKRRIPVAGVIVEAQGRILILHRVKKDGAVWGLPAGGIEQGETPAAAAARELAEETGIVLPPERLVFLGLWKAHFPRAVVEFNCHRVVLDGRPDVRLDTTEHDAFLWLTPEECLRRKDLIRLLADIVRKAYPGTAQRQKRPKKRRSGRRKGATI